MMSCRISLKSDCSSMRTSRRTFVRGTVAALACGSRLSRTAPLGLAPGVQLWSVREELKRDPQGTLLKLSAIGYREVELFEMPKSPREFRKEIEDASLTCISGHFEMKDLKDPVTIEAARELGQRYMILVFPELRSWQGQSVDANFEQFVPRYEKISLSDYKWNADQLNKCGENLKRHGMRAGYHNHAIDFKDLGGTLGFDELIKNTDPNLVCFEMDCGHVIHAGHDPISCLNKYPSRIELLHLKDLVRGYKISTTLDTEDKDTNAEIGAGCIDWKKLFETAARHGYVKHYFVEHEGRMAHPPLEALQISYNYLQTI